MYAGSFVEVFGQLALSERRATAERSEIHHGLMARVDAARRGIGRYAHCKKIPRQMGRRYDGSQGQGLSFTARHTASCARLLQLRCAIHGQSLRGNVCKSDHIQLAIFFFLGERIVAVVRSPAAGWDMPQL